MTFMRGPVGGGKDAAAYVGDLLRFNLLCLCNSVILVKGMRKGGMFGWDDGTVA